MTRQQRRAINRANSAHSTGPLTAQGKAASSLNSTTHGLSAQKPYLPAEQTTYEAFAAEQLDRLDPQTPTEHEFAMTIIDTKWRLQRIPTLEARLFAATDSEKAGDAHKIIRSLDILSRHEVRLRKLLDKTFQLLQFVVMERRKLYQTQPLSAQHQETGFVSHHAAGDFQVAAISTPPELAKGGATTLAA